MARIQPQQVATSVRQRLLNQARAENQDFQVLLTRYVLERFLYRLSLSSYQDSFVVKGAMLFLVWEGTFHRTTRDLDLLGFGSSNLDHVETYVRDICLMMPLEEDGVIFQPETLRSMPIREDHIYDGVRVTIEARLGSARIPLQIDIGFGDAITPEPREVPFPVLLGFPAPTLRVYPKETVVAEKLQAMVELGIGNSRMKDFYDLWYLSSHFAFDGPTLVQAVRATFDRRYSRLPKNVPLALTDEFAHDSMKQTQWKAFLRKGRLRDHDVELPEVIEALRVFLWPVVSAAATEPFFEAQWLPPGPWEKGTR